MTQITSGVLGPFVLFGDLLSNLYWELLPTHKLWLLIFNIILNSCCDYITFSKCKIKLFILIFPPFLSYEKRMVLIFCSPFCVSFSFGNSNGVKKIYTEKTLPGFRFLRKSWQPDEIQHCESTPFCSTDIPCIAKH